MSRLQGRLGPQPVQRPRGDSWNRAGARGELLHGADARLPKVSPLAHAHAGHQQQVPRGGDLCGAGLAPPARHEAGVTPLHRVFVHQPLRNQRLQPGTTVPVDRDQVGEAMQSALTVAAQQRCLASHRDASPGQQVRVGRDLQQRRNLVAPCQLGVLHHVDAALAHDEVGVPHQSPVEHGSLREHVDAPAQHAHGLGSRARQGLDSPARTFQHQHATAVGGVAELGAVSVQNRPLVLVAHPRDPVRKRVRVDRGAGSATQPDVQVTHHRELARRRPSQVRDRQQDAA